MLAFLQQPYVFALALALVTALLSFAYAKVTDKEPGRPAKTFFKTMAAGTLAGIALTYLTSSKAEPLLATEPFDAPAVASGI